MAAARMRVGYRQRAIGAVVASAVLIVLAAGALAMTLADVVADHRDQLSRARRAIALAERLPPGGIADVLSARESRLLAGKNAGEAQAALQTALKDIAQRHEMTIESLQPMPVERGGGLIAARLKVVATVTESRLGSALTAMIESVPQLAFEAVEIRPDLARTAEGQPAEERRLAIRLDVAGFARSAPTAREAP